MRYRLSILLFTALVVGCAGEPPVPQGANVSARGELVCKMETPTGSHLPKRVCRYESDILAEEEKVRLMEDKMRNRVPIDPDRDTG